MIWETKAGRIISEISAIDSADMFDDALRDTLDSGIVEQKIREQWEKGENKDRQHVGYYSPFTEEISKVEHPIMQKVTGQPYNLLWSGDLFERIFTTITDDAVLIDSVETLAKKDLFSLIETVQGYVANADSIFGLQEENFKLFQKEIREKVIEDVKHLFR